MEKPWKQKQNKHKNSSITVASSSSSHGINIPDPLIVMKNPNGKVDMYRDDGHGGMTYVEVDANSSSEALDIASHAAPGSPLALMADPDSQPVNNPKSILKNDINKNRIQTNLIYDSPMSPTGNGNDSMSNDGIYGRVAPNALNWTTVELALSEHDYGIAFEEVLNKGTLDDLARAMETMGPKPEYIAVNVRNRIFDGISTLLNRGHHLERSLVWCLALVRGRLVPDMTSSTLSSLKQALSKVGSEPSKRGLLAAMLEESIRRADR